MKELLKRVIFDQKEYIYPSDIERVIDHSLIESPEIIVISGVRRCGKSVLLQQIRKKQKEQDYFLNFDDERLIQFKVEHFQALYEAFIELFGEQHTFYFDEIQNIVGWERFVRRLYDAGNKVYITGSNANMLSRELGTHLTGRYIGWELYPFSFKEYLTLKHISFEIKDSYSTIGRSTILSHFHKYMTIGGFPQYILQENDSYLSTLYESIIYKDVLTRNKLSNEREMLEMIHYLASNATKRFTYSSLAKTIGVKHSETVKSYLGYVEDTFLISQLLRFDYSLKSQMASPKKIYFIDNSLINKIGFNATDNEGQQLENLVFIEMKRRGHDLFYHSKSVECDFVIRKGTTIVEAYQVSISLNNEKTRIREIAGLNDALNCYQLSEGYILTLNEEEEIVCEDGKVIHIIPVWKWLLG